jgi:hypothetical protein
MARKKVGDITFEEIIRDAFEAGFRSLGGDPVRPEPRSRKPEPPATETRREVDDLGEFATTLP